MDATTMSYQAAVNCGVRLYKSGLRAFFVLGPPGCGKTSMMTPIAQAMGRQHTWTIKLSHHEVPDVAGVPVAREDTRRTHFYASADMLPPDSVKSGLLVVIDEVGDCNQSQQNLICQWVFENRMHSYSFPSDTIFFLTSNRVADRSGANRIVTKLGNRVAMATVRPTVDELGMYGMRHGWNPVLLAFLKMHGDERITPQDNRQDAPTFFNSFDPTDPAQMVMPQFASSRSYEFMSGYLNYIDEHEPNVPAGTVLSETATIVGTPVASKFTAFRNSAKEMPDPTLILSGKKVPYPTKTSVWWALTLTLCSKVQKDQVKHLHTYMGGAPDEMLAVAARTLFDTRINDLMGPDFHKLTMDERLAGMF